MKKLLLIATTLFFLALRSNAADATIANAPGGALAAIPDTYRMPWENPGVQGYYSSFSVLTNLILSGVAGTGYVAAYYLPLSGGTLSSGLTNNSVAGYYGNGANLTNVPFYIYTNWAASQINPYNASGLAFAPGYGMTTDWGITAGGIVVRTNGIDTSTVITTNGGSFYGSVFSLSVTTNAPANNELVTAGWVRELTAGQGVSYYATTNIAVGFTNITSVDFVYAFDTNIPPYIARRVYTAPAAGDYVGSVAVTNRLLQINAAIVVNAYMENSGGIGLKQISVHPEIYISYDGTNWLGDWDAQNQSITTGTTNLYTWLISNPSYTATNATGFYLQRRFKVGAQSGGPNLTFHLGTNSPSHIDLSASTSLSGNAYLAANQTFTGSNTFSQNISGSVVPVVSVITLTGGTNAVVDLTKGSAFSLALDGTNAYFSVLPTSAKAMQQFTIEVTQGTGAHLGTVTFNTNYWMPPTYGQILTMPTNTAGSAEIISCIINAAATTNRFWQTLFP